MPWPPSISTLFPYTTLFRSLLHHYQAHKNAGIRKSMGQRMYEVEQELSDAKAFMELQNRSEEHTSELQSRRDLVCRLQLEKKNFTLYMNRQAQDKFGLKGY